MTETFDIIPASGVAVWFGGLLALLTIIIGAAIFFISYSFYSSQHTQFIVTAEGLRIKGDLFGRLIPKDKIQFSLVRVVYFNQQQSYNPKRRTMGTAMPGYYSGWFRLQNGEKSLIFLTERSKAVYIPTSLGYSVMVSVTKPTELIDALNRLARL
jgi:hypothetical protein